MNFRPLKSYTAFQALSLKPCCKSVGSFEMFTICKSSVGILWSSFLSPDMEELQVDWYCGVLHCIQVFHCYQMAVGSLVQPTQSEHVPWLEDRASFWKELLKQIRQGFRPRGLTVQNGRECMSLNICLSKEKGERDCFYGYWSMNSWIFSGRQGMNLISQNTGNHVRQVPVHHAKASSKSQKVTCQVDSVVILVNPPG